MEPIRVSCKKCGKDFYFGWYPPDTDFCSEVCEIASLKEENNKLRDQLRWRDAYGDTPTEHGSYFVINYDFDGGTSIHVARWDGKWPIFFTVSHWRPIGPLPGGE